MKLLLLLAIIITGCQGREKEAERLHHVAISYDGNYITVFVDGVPTKRTEYFGKESDEIKLRAGKPKWKYIDTTMLSQGWDGMHEILRGLNGKGYTTDTDLYLMGADHWYEGIINGKRTRVYSDSILEPMSIDGVIHVGEKSLHKLKRLQ